MRALPGFSVEYLADTVEGNTALPRPTVVGAVSRARALLVAGVGAAGAAAAASVPHSALRKSFHLMPLTVPEDLAALYFALHSCMVSACVGPDQAKASNAAALADIKQRRIDIVCSLCRTIDPCSKAAESTRVHIHAQTNKFFKGNRFVTFTWDERGPTYLS